MPIYFDTLLGDIRDLNDQIVSSAFGHYLRALPYLGTTIQLQIGNLDATVDDVEWIYDRDMVFKRPAGGGILGVSIENQYLRITQPNYGVESGFAIESKYAYGGFPPSYSSRQWWFESNIGILTFKSTDFQTGTSPPLYVQCDFNFSGTNLISGLLDPASAQDAATKNYVDTKTWDRLTSTNSTFILSDNGTDATLTANLGKLNYLGAGRLVFKSGTGEANASGAVANIIDTAVIYSTAITQPRVLSVRNNGSEILGVGAYGIYVPAISTSGVPAANPSLGNFSTNGITNLATGGLTCVYGIASVTASAGNSTAYIRGLDFSLLVNNIPTAKWIYADAMNVVLQPPNSGTFDPPVGREHHGVARFEIFGQGCTAAELSLTKFSVANLGGYPAWTTFNSMWVNTDFSGMYSSPTNLYALHVKRLYGSAYYATTNVTYGYRCEPFLYTNLGFAVLAEEDIQVVAGKHLAWTGTATAAGTSYLYNDATYDYLYSAATVILKMQANKLGLYGVAPVVQPGPFTLTYATASHTHPNLTAATVATTASTNVAPYGYTTAAQADAIPTQINNLLTDVTNLKKVVNGLINDMILIGATS